MTSGACFEAAPLVCECAHDTGLGGVGFSALLAEATDATAVRACIDTTQQVTRFTGSATGTAAF